MSFHHIPVLLNEVLKYLNPQPGKFTPTAPWAAAGTAKQYYKPWGRPACSTVSTGTLRRSRRRRNG